MHYIMLYLIMLAGCATTMPISEPQYQGTDKISQEVKQLDNSPEPPNWVLGREHNKFAHAQYLVGVGFSNKNTVSASESARAELAKNIRFKIASVMKDYNSNDLSLIHI